MGVLLVAVRRVVKSRHDSTYHCMRAFRRGTKELNSLWDRSGDGGIRSEEYTWVTTRIKIASLPAFANGEAHIE